MKKNYSLCYFLINGVIISAVLFQNREVSAKHQISGTIKLTFFYFCTL